MNIRIIEEENRLHLVFEGTTGSTNDAIKAFIRTISGDVSETVIEDFDATNNDLSPEQEAEIIAEANTVHERPRDEFDQLYDIFFEEFKKGREKYYYSSIQKYGSMSDQEKLAYTIAFKVWIKDYYSTDPYVEADKKYANLKNHRGFFKVFAKMLPDEIASAEAQFGIEKGKFADFASNDEIMQVFELCRKSLLERADA